MGSKMLINKGLSGAPMCPRTLAHDSNKNNGLQVRQYPPHTPPRSIGAPGNAPMRANVYRRTSAHIGALAQPGDPGHSWPPPPARGRGTFPGPPRAI